jgi:enoyl-CoA hydratase/carnithine racemase
MPQAGQSHEDRIAAFAHRETSVLTLDDYQGRYTSISLERSSNGVLLVRLHTDGGPFVMTRDAHNELSQVFYDIAADRANRVVVLTGTGNSFSHLIDTDGLKGDKTTPSGWDHVSWSAERIVVGSLDIDVPLITAINGPLTVFPCWPFAGDVMLCSEDTVIQDSTHFIAGRVPGDGNNIIFEMLLGPVRARYFLLTGQRISAQEALSLGLVNEVLPADALLPRAMELANSFAEIGDVTLRATRRALTFEMRRRVRADIGHGLAIEGLAYIDNPPV